MKHFVLLWYLLAPLLYNSNWFSFSNLNFGICPIHLNGTYVCHNILRSIDFSSLTVPLTRVQLSSVDFDQLHLCALGFTLIQLLELLRYRVLAIKLEEHCFISLLFHARQQFYFDTLLFFDFYRMPRSPPLTQRNNDDAAHRRLHPILSSHYGLKSPDLCRAPLDRFPRVFSIRKQYPVSPSRKKRTVRNLFTYFSLYKMVS